MKKFKYSIIFILLIIIFHVFFKNIDGYIKTSFGVDITNYIIFGFLIPFLIIILIKVIIKKNDLAIFTVLLITGIILYFFIIKSHTPLIMRLSLFLFFILGVFFSFENNNKILIPVLSIVLTAIVSQFLIQKSFSISFYHYDIFIRILISFSGYIATSFGFKK